jgi:hypothetical protein
LLGNLSLRQQFMEVHGDGMALGAGHKGHVGLE